MAALRVTKVFVILTADTVRKRARAFSIYARTLSNPLMKTTGTSALFSLTLPFIGKNELQDTRHYLAEPVSCSKEELGNRCTNPHDQRARMESWIMTTQGRIIKALEDLENESLDVPEDQLRKFKIDRWTREEGGGGITCIIEDGKVFERAGVNISVVYGTLPPPAVAQMRSRGKNFLETTKSMPFFAAGISSVIHPTNPNVPTLHFNYRYFEAVETDPATGKKIEHWWFGGGTDMTPYILHEDDVVHFHLHLKDACEKHSRTHYRNFKKWCDDYFVITHRNERRGVGGIFFDDLDKPSRQDCFEFVRSCCRSILPSYVPIVERRMNQEYTPKDREWQLIRRGRYVEFNLVYDRGTKFGLATPGARIESIFMSLPLNAQWKYRHEPEPDSNHAKLMEVLKNPRDWVNAGRDRPEYMGLKVKEALPDKKQS